VLKDMSLPKVQYALDVTPCRLLTAADVSVDPQYTSVTIFDATPGRLESLTASL
jgi:hypothetical protein